MADWCGFAEVVTLVGLTLAMSARNEIRGVHLFEIPVYSERVLIPIGVYM